jgi:molybdate transport system substrate-binding protein
MTRKLCALLLCLAVLAPRAHAGEELLVSAAASLSAAFKEIGAAFDAANRGTRVSFNFAASGALLQQIERGAPVDVFASADQETMDQAQRRGLVLENSRRDFTANRLVLVVPAGSALDLKSAADLNGPGVRRVAVGNPAQVPAGRYARDALGPAAWDALKQRLVYAESVRQALQYASLGEVDAAFVYASDAAAAGDKVRVAATLQTPKPIAYPAAVVAASRRQELARRFVEFLSAPQAQSVLRRHGFGG